MEIVITCNSKWFPGTLAYRGVRCKCSNCTETKPINIKCFKKLKNKLKKVKEK
jgi:hypothetical protein